MEQFLFVSVIPRTRCVCGEQTFACCFLTFPRRPNTFSNVAALTDGRQECMRYLRPTEASRLCTIFFKINVFRTSPKTKPPTCKRVSSCETTAVREATPANSSHKQKRVLKSRLQWLGLIAGYSSPPAKHPLWLNSHVTSLFVRVRVCVRARDFRETVMQIGAESCFSSRLRGSAGE